MCFCQTSNFHAYQKTIQEQMMHESKFHDKHFPALVTSTRVSRLSRVVERGCLFFGDHHFAEDDAADDEDVATADDDEACFALKCENADAAMAMED